jgi:hypothetical protein
MNKIELKKVRKALSVLMGLPLWATGRAGLQWFQFGEKVVVQRRDGVPKKVGTYALHVDCPWRIIGPKGIIVGSHDRFYRAFDPENQPEDFAWDVPGANRCDARTDTLFAKLPREFQSVTSIEADLSAGFRLWFGEKYALEVFPNDTMGDEYWRLFRPGKRGPHFVVTGNGVEN